MSLILDSLEGRRGPEFKQIMTRALVQFAESSPRSAARLMDWERASRRRKGGAVSVRESAPVNRMKPDELLRFLRGETAVPLW